MLTHDKLALRVKRLRNALNVVRNDDLSTLPVQSERQGPRFTGGFDFSKDHDEAQVENAIWTFIASVASLKDHLKDWCNSNGAKFEGDALIDSNRDVAIVHDLWNRDKHSTLKHSRSGLYPELIHTRKCLVLDHRPGQTQARLTFTVTPKGLEIAATSSFIGIDGIVVDNTGAKRGSILFIAERAIVAWEQTMVRAGVVLPPQSGNDDTDK